MDRHMERALEGLLDGSLRTYFDPTTKQTYLHFSGRDGSEQEMTLDDRTLHNKTPIETFRHIVDSFTKQLDTVTTKALGDGTDPNEKRAADINAELDIIRGRVPTPPGYVIDIEHAKDLMDELRKIAAAKEAEAQA